MKKLTRIHQDRRECRRIAASEAEIAGYETELVTLKPEEGGIEGFFVPAPCCDGIEEAYLVQGLYGRRGDLPMWPKRLAACSSKAPPGFATAVSNM